MDSLVQRMDEMFATAAAWRDRSGFEELQKLTVDHGVHPSTAIAKARILYRRIFGGNSDLVERIKITELLEGQAARHSFLAKHAEKLLDQEFAVKSLGDWESQFQMFESTASYKAAMKSVQLGASTTTPASTPIARKKATINAVGAAELCPQQDDDADDGVSGPAADVLERVAAVLGNASPSMGSSGVMHSRSLAALRTCPMLRHAAACTSWWSWAA